MDVAGVNWTMPATPGWDNSDMAMFTGDNEIMGRIKRAHFETAARLRVKKIVMGECGHAFRSVYDVGNRWLGWRMPPIPIVHAIEFYYDLISSGKISIAKKFEQPVTLHDPCNVVRGGGLAEKARYVVNAICEELVEMHPNREYNYCCCAGGGVINCGPPYKTTRIKGNRIKAEQLFAAKSRGAEILIAPCHNCHSGLEDINHHYGLDLKIKFIGDILYEVMEKPSA
jgi:Fe-S oxidoreductase